MQRESTEKKTMKIISDLLTEICDESTKDKDTNSSTIKPFLSKKIPSISIKSFFERLLKYTKMENSTLILILIYIDRLCDNQKFLLNYFNIHKIIVASMIIAIKYNEDDYFNNQFYAKVGGVSKNEINRLEYEILNLINFDLFVSEDLFNKYNDYILSVTNENEEGRFELYDNEELTIDK